MILFWSMGLERATGSFKAPVWSTENGEERPKGPNRETLPSGFSSHLVFSSLDLIYTLWMSGSELEMYLREEGKTAGECPSSISVGILGCHLLRRRQPFKITFSSKNALIGGQVTRKTLWKLGPCLCCLTPDSASQITAWWAESKCPRDCGLTSHGSLGGQGSTGRQGPENKGIQAPELAKTGRATSFKKYILFLKNWQQFLQTLESFRDLFPFPLVFLLCFDWLIDWLIGMEGIGPDLVRWVSCSLGRHLDWGTCFGAICLLGHNKLNYRILHGENGSKGKSALWRQEAWVLVWLWRLPLWFWGTLTSGPKIPSVLIYKMGTTILGPG